MACGVRRVDAADSLNGADAIRADWIEMRETGSWIRPASHVTREEKEDACHLPEQTKGEHLVSGLCGLLQGCAYGTASHFSDQVYLRPTRRRDSPFWYHHSVLLQSSRQQRGVFHGLGQRQRRIAHHDSHRTKPTLHMKKI
eukprot:scaffold2160_cov144-Isochrysis_galbana.AAC.1